jgi:two-component system, chemotaxis family, chemotaxis protein CheY
MTKADPRRHILIVEDDRDIRETLVDILEDRDFQVTAAADGVQALRALHSGNLPDAILLDLMMPNMNGFQFREEQLKNATFARIPVAVLTADVEAKEKAESIRAHAVVKKPLKIQPLLDVIAQLLELAAASPR